jgi:hypothetical protein
MTQVVETEYFDENHMIGMTICYADVFSYKLFKFTDQQIHRLIADDDVPFRRIEPPGRRFSELQSYFIYFHRFNERLGHGIQCRFDF